MTKRKIGLITFHSSYNCGSMLQTYAMQKKIKDYGLDIEVIDFSNDGQKNVYSVFTKEISMKNMVKNFIMLFHWKKVQRNFDSYEDFKNKYFMLSPESYTNINELTDKRYDMVVTGSDQVWNITIEDGDDAYFLPWVKKAKKVAYAPSFGAKNIIEFSDNPEKYKKYLLEFNAISIRENNGKKWLRELCNIDVQVLLDPTLLLEKEDYDVICDYSIDIPKQYIYYYSPGYNKNINDLVNKISKKYNLPVIAYNAKNFYVKGLNYSTNFRLLKLENPSIYLSLIKHATLVITTSFHGTIFSSIYNKKFWTIKNGGMFGSDDRVLTLVHNLDLEDRLIPIEFDDNFDYLKTKNYDVYYNKLQNLKKISIDYIEKNIVSEMTNNEN